MLFDFIHKSSKYFAKYKPAPEVIAEFYLYQIPAQIVQVVPIAALIGSVISMVLLSRTNEVTAMRACGMSPARLALPLAFGGCALSVLAFAINEGVVPAAAQRMHFVQQVKIEGQDSEGVADGSRWVRSGSQLYSFREFDSLNNVMSGVRAIRVGKGFAPLEVSQAREARYVASGDWDLLDVTRFYLTREGTIGLVEGISSETLGIPVEPSKLRKERRKPNEMSFLELSHLIDRGRRLGMDVLAYRVDYHLKFAFPLAAFVVSLIGLKFAFRSERTTETVRGMLLAFIVGLSYWFFMSAARALGLRGDVHPVITAWAANLLILSVSGFQFWRFRSA